MFRPAIPTWLLTCLALCGALTTSRALAQSTEWQPDGWNATSGGSTLAYAFDGNPNTHWQSTIRSTETGPHEWVHMVFNTSRQVNFITLKPPTTGSTNQRLPLDYTVFFWNGQKWKELLVFTNYQALTAATVKIPLPDTVYTNQLLIEAYRLGSISSGQYAFRLAEVTFGHDPAQSSGVYYVPTKAEGKTADNGPSEFWSASYAKDGLPATSWSSLIRSPSDAAQRLQVWFDRSGNPQSTSTTSMQWINHVRLLPRYVNGVAVGFPVAFNIQYNNGRDRVTTGISRSNVPVPTAADGWITIPFPKPVFANSIIIEATILGKEEAGIKHVFQLAEVRAGYNPAYQHVQTRSILPVVAWEPKAYYGFPANDGAWSWGNEVLVGFSQALDFPESTESHKFERLPPPNERLQKLHARTKDGGQSWVIEPFLPKDLATEAPSFGPNFAFKFRNKEYWYSNDRGVTWFGPFCAAYTEENECGLVDGITLESRTDYIVESSNKMVVFTSGTYTHPSGTEIPPRAVALTVTKNPNGSLTFGYRGWMTPTPAISPCSFTEMPSTLQIVAPNDSTNPPTQGTYLTAIRRVLPGTGVPSEEACTPANKRRFVTLYESVDGGVTWNEKTFNGQGTANILEWWDTPASLVRVNQSTVAIVYALREGSGSRRPSKIAGRLSYSFGSHWEPEVTIAVDLQPPGQEWDIGYPRAVALPSGQIMTMFYWSRNTPPPGMGQEKYIHRTIWTP